MNRSRCLLLTLLITLVVLANVRPAGAYVEGNYTLGRIAAESTHVVVMEVAKVNKEKGLVIYKKVEDLKGKHPVEEIKHNIGQKGFHPREWQNVMAWAEVGKRAVFFHNGGASETCIGNYWYQCYPEGEWWGMTHAEPYLLRAYCGDAGKLATSVAAILKGEDVVVPCMMDGSKENLQLRKAKIHRLKASLKRIEYDAKRDFVALGGDGDEIVEYRQQMIAAESTDGWKFLPAAQVAAVGDRWRTFDFDDSAWRAGKAPLGYGEPEIGKRTGTEIADKAQPIVFRKVIDVPAELLAHKGAMLRFKAATDDSAEIYLNGDLVDKDELEDHEFSYWNRDFEIEAKKFRAGKNVIAVLVKNKAGSSDLFLDLELAAEIPIPVKKPDPKQEQKPAEKK